MQSTPASNGTNDELLTEKEVAAITKTCTRTVSNYSKQGLLKEIRFSKRCKRYRRSDVEDFIDSLSS